MLQRALMVYAARLMRKSGVFSGSLFGLVATIAACGPPPAPPPPPHQEEPPKPVVTEKAVDLAPVAAPDRIIFVASMKKPSAVLATAGDWTHFPMPGGEEISSAVLGKPVGDVIDLDQPMHAVGILTGSGKRAKPTFAGSVALRSFDQAKHQFEGAYSLAPIDNGDFEVKGVDDGGDDDDKKSCFIAHAAGPSNARLVCGVGPETARLVPYLVRTVVREPLPDKDLHAEIRLGPARDEMRMATAMLPQVVAGLVAGSSNGAFNEMAEAGVGDVADFVLDLDRFALDANMNDKALTADLGLAFETKRALLSQLGTAHADKVGPPPAAFMHLPADTDFAMWGSGIDAKLVEHPRDLVLRAISAAAKEEKLSDADNKAVADALSHTFALTSSPTLYAKGYDEVAVHAAAAKEESTDTFPRQMIASALGWHLWRVEEPVAKVGPTVKEWATTWNRPSLQKWVKTEWGKGGAPPTMRVTPVAAGLKLPKDTVHLEIAIDVNEPAPSAAPSPVDMRGGKKAPAPKAAAAPAPKRTPEKPVVLHVFAIPDAGATVLAIGLDDKIVAQKALASLSTAPSTETLSTAPGFEAFKDARGTGGGFMTMHALIGLSKFGRDPSKRLVGLSNNARTPLAFAFSTTQPGDRGKEGAMTTTIRVPKELVIDFVKTAMH
jgi:hypothetical protein